MKTFFLLPVMTIFSFCSSQKAINYKDKNIDEISYSYHDSSVPPPFQRNFTINLKADKAQMIVNSYGKLISDTSIVITQKQFDDIIGLLDSGKIRNDSLGNNDGCTGGDGESLSCYSKDSLIFSGDVYHCGGKDSGNLKGNIDSISYALVNMFPNFDLLLNRK